MKIKGEMYVRMRECMSNLLDYPGFRESIEKQGPKLSPSVLWDWWHIASFDLFHTDEHPTYQKRDRLTPYWGSFNTLMGEYKDSHIATALRKIATELLA